MYLQDLTIKIWYAVKTHHHHHHHVVPLARISLTLTHHFSLLFIASVRSSGLHPVSSHSCCIYVRVLRPAFARPYVGVHRSTWLMSSSLLLQLCPACLLRLTWIVFVMGGRWPYSWCRDGVLSPGYDSEPPDSEVPNLAIWGIWSTPSLPLLLGLLWPRIVVPVRVSSMGLIEHFYYLKI